MLTAAERFAALDADDPSPSWNECARRAGIPLDDAGVPGDRFASDFDVTVYWPVVRPCYEELLSASGYALIEEAEAEFERRVLGC